ncbi:hypothetical protein BaRGS_00028032 [Batillaria attramentaria]|uniref:Apolipoprotein D n=1 Tax=Batillaria attramentaria TaxID=370345 RepID=A0ABD0K0A3_9CAEN
MNNFVRAVVLCCCVVFAVAQLPGFGGCPSAVPQATLNITRYLGDWYEIYRFPAFFERGQKCVTAHYRLKDNGHIHVLNSGYKNGEYISAIGDVYRPDENEQGKLLVRFGEGTPYGDYWVMDTDYENYTLIFSCGAVLGPVAHVESAWILSRWPQLDQETVDRLFGILKNAGVNTDVFYKVDQSNCPGMTTPTSQ